MSARASTLRRRTAALLGVGMAAVLVVATVVSLAASPHPDGLERVAGELGFLDTARDSWAAGSPLAGYAARGVADGWPSLALAGAIGCVAVFAVASGAAALAVRARQRREARAAL